MKRTDLINYLIAKGYKAEATEKVKNGVLFEGIIISDDVPIAPIIYTEKMIEQAEKEGKSIADVVEEILRIYESSRDGLKLDIQQLFEKEWVLEHLTIGLQKTSDQDLIKKEVKDMPGIEAYLYVKDQCDEGSYEMKMSKEHVKSLKISCEEIWEKAYENVCGETCILSMEQILNEMMGMPLGCVDESEAFMYVISNKERVKGAACALNKEALQFFAKKKGVKRVFLLPSSVHEMILVPDNGSFSLNDLSMMVEEVNATQVEPVEQLPDRAYVVAVN